MDANSKRTPSTPKAQAKVSTTKSHPQQVLAQVGTLGELAEVSAANLVEGNSAIYRHAL
ncbi:MAG: hypothetical protein V3W41_17970 [Planctomycetota bacterium]